MKEYIIEFSDNENALSLLVKAYNLHEIVRCKDCKYFDINGCDEGFGWCERNGIGHGSTTDWYCADGERKEGR